MKKKTEQRMSLPLRPTQLPLRTSLLLQRPFQLPLRLSQRANIPLTAQDTLVKMPLNVQDTLAKMPLNARDNGGQKKKIQVHTCTTSKRIELESRGWSQILATDEYFPNMSKKLTF